MGRLVAISNRTAAGSAKAGGLAVAVWDALVESRGVWYGWSGDVVEQTPRGVEMVVEDGVEFALTDLTHEEHDGFYLGFSNRALWPVLHYRTDLAYFDEDEFEQYVDVNARFSRLVAPRLLDDDMVWVHDYHFFLLGQDLRNEGWEGRTGYFLHVPFPPPEVFRTVPHHHRLARALCAYDVIGLQTEMDRRNLEHYFIDELGAERLDEGLFKVAGRTIRIRSYPIGIDAGEFARLATEERAQGAAKRLSQFLQDRDLILGVDRMDYSKGIPNRFDAVGCLLDHYPEHRGSISYTQIAPPSRSKVEEYQHLRSQLDKLAGRINGDYGDLDWIPIRYLARPYPREELAGIFRIAKVGFVTPLHDGMNLVAKEYVAAQDPENPGVLVLSEFAGAAEQMREGAVLVNPHDKNGMADRLHEALKMPLDERKRRWKVMMDQVCAQDIAWWRETFLDDLTHCHDNTDDRVVQLKP
ncbi:trehalose-6-phosphate synthase [Parvularcula sp. LCG005]|uniref:alpha,alpha-trehalose-phosphate synthase (UDP-forming) n=1 Tax=Parvularcula sp. LCG005 TaxID=3078805 RepID=UPI002941E859|nr:trehalose-6-phosphate synthase [Parvularcula sp. LCG005]WOI54268.1 trehalose-6-phosphate synthase [Parvularcula sp. LCG005]